MLWFSLSAAIAKGCRGNRQEKRDETKGDALYGQSDALCSVVAKELCLLKWIERAVMTVERASRNGKTEAHGCMSPILSLGESKLGRSESERKMQWGE